MGLLDHYKQYEGLTEREVSENLRHVAAERRAKALERIDPIDLSRTTWPGMPHPYVVQAITYAARKGMHTYADPHASALRSQIAHRHGVRDEHVVVGNGVAQLLAAASGTLMEPGDELVTPWPSYPLYPLMARRAHGRAVPVQGFSAEAILAAVNESTRLVVICNPNDPTGDLMGARELDGLLDSLPERVVTLVDEALVEYAGPEARGASMSLLDRHPRLLVFRSLSKAWGLAGLRTGYAVAAPGSEALLAELEPDLGVDELAQAGALEALRSTEDHVMKRAVAAGAERDRVAAGLRELGVEVGSSHANVLWMRAPGVDGATIAGLLQQQQVIVQPGGAIGEPDFFRAAVHLKEHGDRLLRAVEVALQSLDRSNGAGR